MKLDRLTDAELAGIVGALLFALAAWPIPLLDVPPYQDLAGHMATATIISNPELYPEFVFNGFLKTNATLIVWLVFVGKVVGAKWAAKSFVLLTLAANAFVFPRFVLQLTDRRRMLVASVFLVPMIHNWWVSMGMLNFALSVPLALELLVRLDRQRAAPTALRGVGIVLLSLLTWLTHSIPLLVVCFLVAVQVILRPTWRDRWADARSLAAPLVPAFALVAFVMLRHVMGTASANAGVVETIEFEPPAWELYDTWAKWFYGFTPLSASSVVTAVGLAVLAVREARGATAPVRFFSLPATTALLLALFLLPYVLPGFGYVNMRVLPFVWMAALVRLPASLPAPAMVLFAVAGISSSAGMAIDLFRVENDSREFVAGIDAVPERARLLTLNFRRRKTSKNTWSLHTSSGLYVVAKHTSAQDIWADSPTMPIMHAKPPDALSDPVRVRRFVDAMQSRQRFCAALESEGLAFTDCDRRWREQWEAFWQSVTPRFDHVLMWEATPDALERVPSTYRIVFDRDGLRIFARAGQ